MSAGRGGVGPGLPSSLSFSCGGACVRTPGHVGILWDMCAYSGTCGPISTGNWESKQAPPALGRLYVDMSLQGSRDVPLSCS